MKIWILLATSAAGEHERPKQHSPGLFRWVLTRLEPMVEEMGLFSICHSPMFLAVLASWEMGVCEVIVGLVEGERREEESSVRVGAAIIGDEGPELYNAMELVEDEMRRGCQAQTTQTTQTKHLVHYHHLQQQEDELEKMVEKSQQMMEMMEATKTLSQHNQVMPIIEFNSLIDWLND